jgi:hypothetical protein
MSRTLQECPFSPDIRAFWLGVQPHILDHGLRVTAQAARKPAKQVLEAWPEAEMSEHLGCDKHDRVGR